MSYALVHDVPASWDRYPTFARSLGSTPAGLLLHVAGPTDEGFRIIEVWESEGAWLRFADQLDLAMAALDPEVRPRAVVRHLHAIDVVFGAAWPPAGRDDPIAVGPGPMPDVATAADPGRRREP